MSGYCSSEVYCIIPAPLSHSTKVSIYFFSRYILINVHIVVSSENILNHPMPRPSKVCSMVKAVIQQSTSSNSSLKPSLVAQGKGVPFVPGVVDEASSHIGRVAQVVKRARQKSVYGQSWDIANFETIADQIDSADERYASRSSDENEEDTNLTRPYTLYLLVLKMVSGTY